MLQPLTVVDKDKGQGTCNNRLPTNHIDLPSIEIKTKETSIRDIIEMFRAGSTIEVFKGTNRVEMHQGQAHIDHQGLIKGLEVVWIFPSHLLNLIPGFHNSIKATPQVIVI